MLAKLITLPMASAIASASSPSLRRRMMPRAARKQEQCKEGNHGQPAKSQQPREAYRGHGRQLQMVGGIERD